MYGVITPLDSMINNIYSSCSKYTPSSHRGCQVNITAKKESNSNKIVSEKGSPSPFKNIVHNATVLYGVT